MRTLICIAGGSGSGKSTLADRLLAHFGANSASVLHLDDYQYEKQRVPLTEHLRRNYDHPSSVDLQRFADDLAMLRNGSDVVVMRRMKRALPDEGVDPVGRIHVRAKPFVIVEGYLTLYSDAACALYDVSIFLRATAETRVARRRWVKDEQYVREVLLPMHDHFIEPTARYADFVIDVDGLSEDDVCEMAADFIERRAQGPCKTDP